MPEINSGAALESFEAIPFVTTKKQLEEVFQPASRPDTQGKRSPYVTLFAVRRVREIEFAGLRARSIETGNDMITQALEFVEPDEPIILGYFAKNKKDRNTFETRVGKRQKEYFAKRGIKLVFRNKRKRI